MHVAMRNLPERIHVVMRNLPGGIHVVMRHTLLPLCSAADARRSTAGADWKRQGCRGLPETG